MSFRIEGNGLRRLERLGQKLSASEPFMRQTLTAMQREALQLVKEGFATEQSPSRSRWARKRQPDGRKVLRGKTGRLRRFTKGSVRRSAFGVKAGAKYWRFHQYGTRSLVPRRMLADSTTGLTPRWRSRLQRTATTVARRHFKL